MLTHFFIVYHRLMALAKNQQENKDMINWLLTGYIPRYDAPPAAKTPDTLIERLKKRRNTMKPRGKGSNKPQLITEDELIDLCINNSSRLTLFKSKKITLMIPPPYPHTTYFFSYFVPHVYISFHFFFNHCS